MAPRPVVQVHVPLHGPAEIAGIPIADSLLEQMRANATIEPVLVDDDGAPVTFGRRSPGLSPKIARAVLLRDGQPLSLHCDRKGNHVHHLRPRSWGGTDDPRTWPRCARVPPTRSHPARLLALVGNPNLPDGIWRKVHLDDLTPRQREQAGLPPPRAGPAP